MDPGQLARNHLDRPEHGRLFGIGQRIPSFDTLHPVGYDGQVERPRQALVTQGLGQEVEAVEAVLDVLVEEARARAEALGIRHQPEMYDLAGRAAVGDEILDQRVVARPAELGCQGVLLGASLVIGVSLVDADHPMPLVPELLLESTTDSRVVHEEQPGLGAPLFAALDGGGKPDGAMSPVGQILDPLELRQILVGRSQGRGLDEIGLMIPGVGRKLDAAGMLSLPERREVHVETRCPGATEASQEMRRVGGRIVAMAQGGDDIRTLASGGVLSSEGAECLPGADLDQQSPGDAQDRIQTVGELHRTAQVLDPIIRARRLLVFDQATRAVGDEGNPGRIQLEPLQDRPEIIEDRVVETRVGRPGKR